MLDGELKGKWSILNAALYDHCVSSDDTWHSLRVGHVDKECQCESDSGYSREEFGRCNDVAIQCDLHVLDRHGIGVQCELVDFVKRFVDTDCKTPHTRIKNPEFSVENPEFSQIVLVLYRL